MSSLLGDKEKNLFKAVSYIKKAHASGADIVCLPEMFSTGYFCHVGHLDLTNLEMAEDIEGNTISELRKHAAALKISIIAPFVEKGTDAYYNTAVVIDSGGNIVGCYRKTHLPWSHTGWEKFYFRNGYRYPVFEVGGVKIGVLICYDREFPEASRSLALNSAEVIFIPAGFARANIEAWKFVLQTRAYENQLFVFGVGLCGKVDEEHYEFGGNSLSVNPLGCIMSSLGNEEGILLSKLNLYDIVEARKKRFMLRDRRPEIYSLVTEI